MLTVFKFDQIQCCHGGIEVEMKGLFAARLTVGPADTLFGITEQQFDVKTGLVVTINLPSRELGIGGKPQGGLSRVAVLLNPIGDTDRALEPDTVDYRGVNRDTLGFPDQLKAAQVVKFHLAVVLLAAAPWLLRAVVEIA